MNLMQKSSIASFAIAMALGASAPGLAGTWTFTSAGEQYATFGTVGEGETFLFSMDLPDGTVTALSFDAYYDRWYQWLMWDQYLEKERIFTFGDDYGVLADGCLTPESCDTYFDYSAWEGPLSVGGVEIKSWVSGQKLFVRMWNDLHSYDLCTDGADTGITDTCAILLRPMDTYVYFTTDGPQSLNWSRHQVVPEPATWALMIAGFGLSGAMLRRRKGAPSSR